MLPGSDDPAVNDVVAMFQCQSSSPHSQQWAVAGAAGGALTIHPLSHNGSVASDLCLTLGPR